MDVEIWKYVATQGGLTIVCLVEYFYTRRDNAKRAREDRERIGILIELVEKNTEAFTEQKASTDRVARALEAWQNR